MDQSGLNVVGLFVIEDSGQEVLVSPVLDANPVFIIGSDPRNHLHLDDPDVVSGHVVVSRRDDEYSIEPRYKGQTVAVNGKRIIGKTRLLPGDVVQIGATQLRFEVETRRTQATSIKPAVQQQAVLPVSTAHELVFSVPQSALAQTSGGAIYYPKSRDKERGESVPLLLMVLVGIGVLLFLGFQLLTGGNTGAAAVEVRPIDYAYNDGNINVLVFHINDCEPCAEQVAVAERVADEMRGDVFLYSYNLSLNSYWSLATRYEVVSVPTTVILDDQGRVYDTIVGLLDDAQLTAVLQEALLDSANN